MLVGAEVLVCCFPGGRAVQTKEVSRGQEQLIQNVL